MNKADLSAKWGKYCDTNQLVDDTMALLTRYRHNNCENGVCKMLDTYFTNKESLIQLFMTSNHYIGNMRISLEEEFDRQIDANELWKFFRDNGSLFQCNLRKTVDNDNKKMFDYLVTGKTSVTIDGLSESNPNLEKLRQFSYHDGVTHESENAQAAFVQLMDHFESNPYSKVQKNFDASSLDKNAPILVSGTKMSRAFNKVCGYYGIDKREGYNKAFAQYADLVSELKRKMSFIISLNPLDYLTMSVGNSWHSCHHIENGGYKGGCLSYMLDSTSIITFVVANTEGNIHESPKFYRQMYHYENDLFIQNRLYPQGNDGATNLYDKFRNIIVSEFNELLQCDGDWTSESSGSVCSEHIHSEGVHYRDYHYNSSVTMFYPQSKANVAKNHVMTVGHEGICPHCGKPYTEYNRFSHSNCQPE